MNNRFLARDAGGVNVLELALAMTLLLPALPFLTKLLRSAAGLEMHTADQLNTAAIVGTVSIVILMAVSVLMTFPLRRERTRAAEEVLPARAMLLMMAFLSVQVTVLGAWVAAEGSFDATRAVAAGLLFALTAAAAVLAFHRLARKALAAV